MSCSQIGELYRQIDTQREVGADGLDQAREVGVFEAHGLGVGADWKDNTLLPGQALLDVDWQERTATRDQST